MCIMFLLKQHDGSFHWVLVTNDCKMSIKAYRTDFPSYRLDIVACSLICCYVRVLRWSYLSSWEDELVTVWFPSHKMSSDSLNPWLTDSLTRWLPDSLTRWVPAFWCLSLHSPSWRSSSNYLNLSVPCIRVGQLVFCLHYIIRWKWEGGS